MKLPLWRRRQKEELEEEVRRHLEAAVRERMERGETRAEAEAAARRQFGNVELVKEVTRDVWGWRWLEHLAQDLRYGVRQLARNPGFTLVAVLTLALGIGANTAIFSMMDAVMLKSLPVKSPEQLYLIAHSGRIETGENSNFPLYKQIRDHSRSFSGVIAINPNQWKATIDGETERVSGQVVTGNYYSTLGVNALLGRTLTVADDEPPGGHPVAVISFSYWTRRFAQAPDVLGRQITINLKPFTIIGVTSPEFFGIQVGRSTDITVPMSMHPQVGSGMELENSDGLWRLTMIGRLNPGVSAEQARAEVDLLLQRFLDQSKMDPHMRDAYLRRIELIPASNGLAELRKQFSEPLRLLMTIVGLVLLIACANVANLLLARAATRQREIGIRLALGGSRFRLIRQLLSESALLGILGGGLGLLFASWAADYLVLFIPQKDAPITLHFGPDLRVLSFTVALSLVTTLLFGLTPALRATKVDLNPALKDDWRGFGSVRARVGLGKPLVVAQVAISLILLIGAGLLVRSLQNLRSLDAGFEQGQVLLFTVDAYGTSYGGARLSILHRDLLERMGALPGVRRASVSNYSPISGGSQGRGISVPGFISRSEEDHGIDVNWVGPNYFETMGIAQIAGRGFGERDYGPAPRVAVINESMARYYFPSENPVGKRIAVSQPPEGGECEIIGVVRDARFESLRKESNRMVYLSTLQSPPWNSLTFALRTSGDPDSLIAAVRTEVRAIGKDIPIAEVRSLRAQVDESLAQERLIGTLSGFFGLLALLLSSIGLYGIIAYAVAHRIPEIGIRMALGAGEGNILWMVVRESLLLVLIGVAIGLPTALAATRLTEGLLFGLTATDPLTIGLATLVMITVAGLAGSLPAWRAARVDPMTALRHE